MEICTPHIFVWCHNFGLFTLYNAIFIRLQAVHVMDVAAAIVAAVKDDGTSMGKTYDLGGPDISTVKDLVC